MDSLRSLAEEKRSHLSTQSGFTLMEVAVVIFISGILMAGMLLGVPQYINNLKAKQTQQRMDLVMNALSVYTQRNYRLPCPAVTTGASRGGERDNGLCFTNSSDRALYSEGEGIVPWKVLGLSEHDVMDGWGRFITYKPAPHLTVNTYASQMQTGTASMDIHNACRNAMWFDTAGTTHLNRQKALFCCNSAPKSGYLTALQPSSSVANLNAGTWRRSAIGAAGSYNGTTLNNTDTIVSTNAWIDNYNATDTSGANYLAGPFSSIYNTDADAPLLRASGQAVTLISHGSNGYFSFLRKQNDAIRLDSTLNGTTGQPSFTGTLSSEEQRNVWPPEQFSASLFHPKSSTNGSYDKGGLRAGASDDMVSWARSDQLFSLAGNATCVRPASTNAVCPLFNYGNFTYVFDTSGSMNNPDFTDSSGIQIPRIQGVKQALLGTNGVTGRGVLAQQIRGEAENDDDPDNIGFTELVYPGATLTQANVLLNVNGNGTVQSLASNGVVNSTIAAGENRVRNASGNGNTPLFYTMLQAAAVTGDGTEAEPTSLLMLSDGEDNSSNMGVGDPRRLTEEKSQMVAEVRRDFGNLTLSSAVLAAVNNPSISREVLFGMIMKDNYPNMAVNIIDVSSTGNTGLSNMVGAVGGMSNYVRANNQTALNNFLNLLSGVCR